jgi:hypothetical protein
MRLSTGKKKRTIEDKGQTINYEEWSRTTFSFLSLRYSRKYREKK